MNPQDVQKQLFSLIELKIKPRKLSAELGQLLSIAPSAVYRRLSGETLLNLEEILILTRHYDVPFEQITNPKAISFELPTLMSSPRKLTEFLKVIENDLIELHQYPNSMIRFAALEVPIFYYLSAPTLAAFKFFMWQRTIMPLRNSFMFNKFSFSDFTSEALLQSRMQSMVDLYNRVESEEIWNTNMFDITLNQMRYCLHAGLFQDTNDVKILIDSSRQLIAHFEKLVAHGKKSFDDNAAPIHIWYNELFQNGMFILSESPHKTMVYNAFDVPNFMVSSHAEMYRVGYNFFNRMKSFSLDIMGVNEINRHRFFDRLYRKIDIFEKELLV
ncbi:MAG: hypothetical protein JNL70_25295 [Saprospiraceae bacterium]|nr:hypothetical protein [Saprospiraceae bacterium]